MLPWTKAFRKGAGKELAIDPSFEFEKRRKIPVKYDRELWTKTGNIFCIVDIIDLRVKKVLRYLNLSLLGIKFGVQEQIFLTDLLDLGFQTFVFSFKALHLSFKLFK